ncbi:MULTISPECIES: hypothetical protein [unclassified Rathayibacter]|uniref:hypothetical protein n=1 Tax=unclassified Rathayibacter TaxID=2609250 RepID=UPI0007012CEA|nr:MULTISPECIES: hypothetical protein [unclassified Rathayibacter]KQQ05923.1 hypothetical protein ASF42_05130 [Rathayibacter sp. Leaf294]KQS13780.1 hypothetical protein ASG06_05140 [Rathayibacter sp. Leaf185]
MNERRDSVPVEEWSPVFSGSVDAVPRETLEAAVRILRLLPGIERVTLSSPHGPIGVERRSSATAWQAADRTAMALLASSADVTGIVAYPYDPRDGLRMATPSYPFLTRDGGVPAAISASESLGEITPAEAARRRDLHQSRVDAEDPLQTLWDAEESHSADPRA